MLFIFGCASVDTDRDEVARNITLPKGVYHKINKGETLWRIAKLYQVNIDDIIKSNQIPNIAQIEENQLILIPDADVILDISSPAVENNKDEFEWPLKGKILNYFSDPRATYLNKGIGIRANSGDPVRASRHGKVVFADYLTGFAYMVVIDHFDGFYSIYSQNSELEVNVGDQVSKGDRIAKVGGESDTVFLHFEIRKDGMANNPLYYLPQL